MNNVDGLQESTLLTFGGFVDEVNPPDLPAGCAAICTDCDFTVQSVKTRDGLESVYTYEGYDQEESPSLGVSVEPPDGAPWLNPIHITTNNPSTPTTVQLNAPVNPAYFNYSENIGIGTGTGPFTINIPFSVGGWSDFTTFNAGDRIVASVSAVNYVFRCVVPGESGGSTPPWVSTPGAIIEDGSVRWENVVNIVNIGDTFFFISSANNYNPSFSPPPQFCALSGVTSQFGDHYQQLGIAQGYPFNGMYNASLSVFYGQVSGVVAYGDEISFTIVLSGDPAFTNSVLTVVHFSGLADFEAYSTSGSIAANGGQLVFSAAAGPSSLSIDAPFIQTSGFSTPLGAQQPPEMPAYEIAPTSATYTPAWGGTPAITITASINLANAAGLDDSQTLEITGYGFSVPSSSQILGIELELTGDQSLTSTLVTLTPNVPGSPSVTFKLPASSGTVTFGGVGEYLGIASPTPAMLNNPSFGFNVTAIDESGLLSTVNLSGAPIKVWFSPPGVENFNYVKTFAQTDGTTLTLALDDTGTWWQEDVENNPDVLVPFFTDTEPETFARSCTQDDREFIALSDLIGGTDVPRQYNGQWMDRLSQVGPAGAPSVTSTSTEYDVVSINQPYSWDMGTIGESVLWSAGPTIQTAGNVVTLYFDNGTDISQIQVGSSVVLAGFGGPFAALNNDSGNPIYQVVSVGAAKPLLTSDTTYPLITITAPGTQLTSYTAQHQGRGDFGTVTLTLAQLVTSEPIPNLQVGAQFTLAGVSPGTWNGTWTVQFTPNAAQLSINTTSLSGNVATYDYTLESGTAPTVGQQVTVTNTANGDGIFNVVNAVVTASNPGSFSISIISPDITAAPETGNGIVNGTIFQFDPLQLIDAGTGGSVVIAGGLGAGTRGCVALFLSRNGLLTQAGLQAIFSLSADANQLVVTNIPIGPPNTIARVIAFTGAGGATQSGGGGFYFWIPEPVTVTDEGQIVTYDATIVNDNVTTQATFNFTDAVLLAGASISSQGSNNFSQVELGSCLGLVPYSLRLAAWGVQNKITNLLNYSFDGGIGQAIPPGGQGGSNVQTYPLGWVVDPASQQDVSVIASPIFGDALFIQNSSGSTQAQWGTITQPAYLDQVKTPIFRSALTYAVRVTASIPAGLTTGSLVIDLFSPSTSTQWGAFTIPFSEMSVGMEIFTGMLLATPFQQVPVDLVIRVYAAGIGAGASVLVDRFEPFVSTEPVATTSLLLSYFNNFEAFDAVTGVLGVADQNQQEVRNAFELFDNLYVVKTGSMVSTTDNGVTEPSGWTVREVSNKCGTPSVYGVDVGEGWALVAGEPGVYLFEGGQPVKISPEIDNVWNSVSWKYGYTLWIRNDTATRRFFIGVPLPTPNKWMPRFPVNANPIKPNVVLMCNYKEIMTSSALQSEGPIRLAYTGELKSYSLGRKWSAWSIEAAYADFITRPDDVDRLFYCPDTSTPKIFQQLAGNYSDDGEAMLCQYVTYPFPKPSEAEQKGMGMHQLVAHFMSMNIIGAGDVHPTTYPNSIDSEDALELYSEPLGNPPEWGDTEIPLNESGNRFFIGLHLENVDEWFELSKMTLAIGPDPFAPVRGSNG